MTIKEFAEKKGIYFFYATIFLLIVIIILSCITFCNNPRSFNKNKFNKRGGSMQMDYRQGRNFNDDVNSFRRQGLLQEENPGVAPLKETNQGNTETN
jgi:hypothetical protein